MNAPLFDKLNEYKKRDIYPFHMPGHKMGRGLKIEDTFTIDITEIKGFDNLHHAEGIIKEAQMLCAKTFGSEETFFLINGSSCGIVGAIMAVCSEKEVIVARNCHKSVFDGLVLSGAKPSYIMPEVVNEFPIFGGFSPSAIEKACQENPNAKAVIIVSPTYEGVVSDIEAIADIVHNRNMVLIVDEAHGAHFNFNDYFPKSAVSLGADIVIQSLHKTLPCPTQTSLIHVCGNRVDRERLKKCLTMVQSSSPSYILMGAIDKCRAYLDGEGKKDFEEYVNRLKDLRRQLKSLKTFRILDSDIVGKNSVFDYDKSKIAIFSDSINCVKIGDILRESIKIELEMCCPTHFLAMTSLCDTQEGLNRLWYGISEMDKEIPRYKKSGESFIYPKPLIKVMPREAFNKDKEEVDFKTAHGRISGEFVIPYPPGIPLLSPGEEITEEIIEMLLSLKANNINVVGTKYSSLEKIVVLK